jgi:retron-type reverse transcriptase
LRQISSRDPTAIVRGGRRMRHLFGVAEAIALGKTHVIDLDLRSYFDGIRHHLLLEKVAKRINDEDVMHLLKL